MEIEQLYSSTRILNGHTELNVYGESWLEHQSIYGQDGILENLNVDAHHFKIRTEGSHLIEFQDGATLNSQFSVGYRSFDEFQPSQSGIELNGDINYGDPIGLSLLLSGGMLLSDDNAVAASNLESTLSVDFGNDNLGMMLEISPTWGQAKVNNIDSTKNNINIGNKSREPNRYTNGIQLNSEVSYGLLLNENSTMNFSSGYNQDYMNDGELKLGIGLTSGENLFIGIDVLTAMGSENNIRNKVKFKWKNDLVRFIRFVSKDY